MNRLFRRRAEERGAAAVEFALLTLLLVPLVIYVIYSGEAVTASIKAAEAEMSAGWEITAFRTHDYQSPGNAKSLLEGAANDSAVRVDPAISDFNSFHDAGTSGHWGVFGHMTIEKLECKRRTSNHGGDFGPSIGSSRLHKDGWVGCVTEVKFENRAAPTNAHLEFNQGKPKIIQSTFEKLTMGGLGPTFKGCDDACQRDGKRGFLVLTDDYGLEDPKPTTVESYGSGNPKYYAVGNEMWSGTGGGMSAGIVSGVTMALIGLGDQGNTGKFKMGYLKYITTKRSFGNHGGGMELHLTPEHEEANQATKNTEKLSQKSYDKRYKDNYMAMKDKDWNGQ